MAVVEKKYQSKLARQQSQMEKEMKSKLKEKEKGFQLKESELKTTIKLKEKEVKEKDSHLKVQFVVCYRCIAFPNFFTCLTNILSLPVCKEYCICTSCRNI